MRLNSRQSGSAWINYCYDWWASKPVTVAECRCHFSTGVCWVSATSSVRVNFRAGSVRQSLWIKPAAPALTFTIVVNYSKFFPRRFTPTAIAASRPCPPPALTASLLLHVSFFILPFHLSTISSSAVPQRLHPPPKDARHRRVHRTSCSSCLLNRLDARLNYTRHHGFWRACFFLYIFFWKSFVGVMNSASCTKPKEMPSVTIVY